VGGGFVGGWGGVVLDRIFRFLHVDCRVVLIAMVDLGPDFPLAANSFSTKFHLGCSRIYAV